MDPREFLKLGDELANQPAAAARRTAISRAYYSAFNTGPDRALIAASIANWRKENGYP